MRVWDRIKCVSLFVIKNRYKILLYKYTRKMQHVMSRALLCLGSWCLKHLEGQNHTEKESMYMHTNNAITTTAVLLQTNKPASGSVWYICSSFFEVPVAHKNTGFYFMTYNSYIKDISTIHPSRYWIIFLKTKLCIHLVSQSNKLNCKADILKSPLFKYFPPVFCWDTAMFHNKLI